MEHTQQALTQVNPHADVLHGLRRLTLPHREHVIFRTWFQGVGLSLWST